ncbi:hypothetical protein SKAU_G00042080 [Synaphobranchus kaupii]|uniref:LEM domain-containing protein n=1 Tax=Synaphobranchus kaupii TaxID=118154 RepID=A0A9Q1G187_SYNKA|nr:hypothetical protein SKAU_G00042080 [Synaphobranchus kaupii]
MAAAQLTDEELFSELKRLGFSPGPVTENTRPVYLKKLKKLREDQQQRGSRSGKTRNSINSGGGSRAAGAPVLVGRPASNDGTYLGSSRNEKRPAGGSKFVLGFSSDESDVESSQKKGGPQLSSRRDHRSGQQQPPLRPSITTPTAARRSQGGGVRSSNLASPSPGLSEARKGASVSPWWADREKSSSGGSQRNEKVGGGCEETEEDDYDEDEAEGETRTLNGSGASYTLNRSKLGGDYSDSEEEEEEEEEEEASPKGIGKGKLDRRLPSRRSQPKALPSFVNSARGAQGGQERRKGAVGANDQLVGDLEEEEEDERKASKGESVLSGGGLRSRGYPWRSDIMGESVADGSTSAPSAYNNNHGGGGTSSQFSMGLKPRFSTYNSLFAAYRSNHSNHTAPNHAYGQARHKQTTTVPEDELLQQFKREEISATGGFSAHYLSMFLLTAACLFFLLLGLMYLRMRGSGGSDADVVIKNHPFGPEFDSSYDIKEKDTILEALLHLHDHLGIIAGEHDCGDHSRYPNRSLLVSEASEYLMLHGPQYEDFFATSLEWVIKSGEDVGIRLIGSDPEEPVTDLSDISRLESTHPKMSFICRFRRAFFMVIHRVLLCIAGVAVVLGVLYYVKYRWRRAEQETRQMYDMVERIIDVLRSHGEESQENRDLQPYLPIPHVRDSLVLPQQRRKMKRGLGEGCGLPLRQRIAHSDGNPEDRRGRLPGVAVWQGKAFPLDRRNSPPSSLTPCLKIRNMFDPIMEVGENWHLAIHEAILEKCSDNDGIVHIAVDKNSREGCVYVKCLSAEHSGKAFKALHGSWFDGKLVTVKYLRLDRYHQRFPQAIGCITPLKPSSIHMNTMAHLRHRSSTASKLGFS